METVSIEEARKTLGDLVDRARLLDEPTLITRNGKPGAMVVNAGWYEEAMSALGSAAGGD